MPSSREIIEDVFRSPSVFKNINALYPEFTPNILPHREEQLRRLAEYFRYVLIEPGSVSQRVLIIGRVGTGKTATAKRFGLDFSAYARQRGIKLEYVHINCHKERTLSNVVRKIAEKLKVPVPTRGISVQELLSTVLNYLEEKDKYAIITLDEFDYFIEVAGSDGVYPIVRLYDEYAFTTKRISFIFIARNYSRISSLDDVTESYLIRNVIEFNPYTSRELRDILKARVEEAFHEGTVDDEVIDYIAGIVGVDRGGSGSARTAIEALRLAGEEADKDGSPKVLVEHVRRAMPYITGELPLFVDSLRNLQFHELLLLLAIIRALKNTGQTFVRIGEVEKEYQYICEELGEEPRKHTQIYEYVRNLKRMELIDARTSGKGYRGKSTLIGIWIGPLDYLEEVVVSEIRRRRIGSG